MKFRCPMIPILLTLMAVLPWTTAVVNCWRACKNCRDITNHPEILDVYCSMCHECRKRRSWMRNGGIENAPTEIHLDYQNQQNEFQPGCPTPPFCESSGEQPYTQRTMLPSKITMPAPILTSSTCPPYPACIKRKRPTPQTQTYPPQQYTTREYQPYPKPQYNPPPYYPPPPPNYNPQYYPPQQDPPQHPPTPQQITEHPAYSPCVPLCPMTCVPGGPIVPGSDNKQWNTKSNVQSDQEATEFSYVYVGVPKELVKEIG